MGGAGVHTQKDTLKVVLLDRPFTAPPRQSQKQPDPGFAGKSCSNYKIFKHKRIGVKNLIWIFFVIVKFIPVRQVSNDTLCRHGAWGMEQGAWSMGHGAWGMGLGAWSMELGAWRLGHGACLVLK
ncbi:MAG: hypothetical protein JNL22_01255 [Bacteroidales bacterium]|nr:hypothetical protein [Bacteroidales bacterium]